MSMDEAKAINIFRVSNKLMVLRKSEFHAVINLSGNELWEGHMYFNLPILHPFIRHIGNVSTLLFLL
jgi:hypothetical protein